MAALAGSSAFALAPSASAQVDPYVGQMIQVGFTFCPRGYAAAQGQLLAIQTNPALFSLIGVTYGGNGTTTFQLPDMRGRMAVNEGSGPGLSPYVLGQQGGAETHSLAIAEMPGHTHRSAIQTANAVANSTTASGAAFGISSNNSYLSGGGDPTGNLMNQTMVQVQTAGSSVPFSVRPPYNTVLWCIATQGIFPPRN
ncbi:MAG: tail fiber protein [Sphingopyxis sp.]|nr:tail fiber protein [Sphingopyxis sp.]